MNSNAFKKFYDDNNKLYFFIQMWHFSNPKLERHQYMTSHDRWRCTHAASGKKSLKIWNNALKNQKYFIDSAQIFEWCIDIQNLFSWHEHILKIQFLRQGNVWDLQNRFSFATSGSVRLFYVTALLVKYIFAILSFHRLIHVWRNDSDSTRTVW